MPCTETIQNHTIAHQQGDPRALHIEKTLQRHGLSGLKEALRPKGKKSVSDIAALYRNYGESSINARPSLSEYVLQLGNALVDWTMDTLGYLIRRGDTAVRVVSSKLTTALTRIYQRASSPVDPERLGQALGRGDLEMLTSSLPPASVIRNAGDDKAPMADFLKMLSRLDNGFGDRLNSRFARV